MYVAVSNYLKPLEELDRWYEGHRGWLLRHYASGRLLVSGRRVPPIGGVILGRAESLEEFYALLAEDPFQQQGLAHYEVFEFNPGPPPWRSVELEAFLNKPLNSEAGPQSS